MEGVLAGIEVPEISGETLNTTVDEGVENFYTAFLVWSIIHKGTGGWPFFFLVCNSDYLTMMKYPQLSSCCCALNRPIQVFTLLSRNCV